ncbi:MAG TPA: YciI family protein [Candidatus Acidoferrum sp.]|nr:YciI family protein [Candidatus Acidoferrum sp.]
MKYVCLVYGEEKEMGAMTDDECMAYDQALRKAGRCLASEALQPVRTATTLRVRQGKVSITDGPFTETKECLAGFYLIEAADLNEAIQVASQIPPARVGSIELRPVRELTSTSGERRQL